MQSKHSFYLLVGTKKGAFVFESDSRRSWRMKGPYFEGMPVHHLTSDPDGGRSLYAAVNSDIWGAVVQKTTDFGRTWKRTKTAPKFPKSSKLKLAKIWHLEVGRGKHAGTVYAGVEPAALFKSGDDGDSWEGIEGLNDHPTRRKWAPSAGGLCLHTVLLDSHDTKRIVVAISAAGAFLSEDRGKSWRPWNEGSRADFLPNKFPVVGQCVHKMTFHPARPDVIYQQTHCGVYRRRYGSSGWTDISQGLPSRYGFPIAVHSHDPKTIYVVPETSDSIHWVPEGRFTVYRSSDEGAHWAPLTQGLPQAGAYLGVHREALGVDDADPCGVYVGTNTGHIFYSRDEGETWQPLAQSLPPIYSIGITSS